MGVRRYLAFGKLGECATSLKKGVHVQVEGELRGHEYEVGRCFSPRLRVARGHVESILELDRAIRREASDADDYLKS